MRSKMVKLLPTVAQQSQQSGESMEIWNDKEIKPNEKTISQVLLSQNNYYSKTRLHGPSRALPPQLNTNISMSMRPACFEVGVPQHRKNDPLLLTTYLYRAIIFYHFAHPHIAHPKLFFFDRFQTKICRRIFREKIWIWRQTFSSQEVDRSDFSGNFYR